MKIEFGYLKGEKCNRDSCSGVIEEYESESGCSCHINPPCSHCTDSRSYCPECDWDGREEQMEYESKMSATTYIPFEYKTKTIEDLDTTKVDWIYSSHTHFSMIKEGVFPSGMSKDDVKKEVNGTFGGRFVYFDNNKCRFKFIAYTD